jgi:peptide/nickel transport system permease protein
MVHYTIRRLLSSLIVLFIVSLLTFIVTRVLFPNPAQVILGGQNSAATPEQIARLNHQLGLDQPVIVQYFKWLGAALTGNLGRSYLLPASVTSTIGARIPVTVELMVLAIALAVLGGLVLGAIGALRRGKWEDTATSTTSVLALSFPNFFLGILLIYVFSLTFRVLPSGGYVPFLGDPLANLRYIILPAVTLAAAYVGTFARYTRSLMSTVLGEDYILRAHASGIRPSVVVGRYAVRNTLVPLITVIGVNVAGLVGGAVVTETIFSLPGIGTLLTTSILGDDLPVLQGLVLVIAVGVVVINFIVDLVYGLIDPRIRVS